MVERAVKVGQENTETFQKRLSFGVFAPNRAALLVSEVKILILRPGVHVQTTISFPLYVLPDSFCDIVRPSVL